MLNNILDLLTDQFNTTEKPCFVRPGPSLLCSLQDMELHFACPDFYFWLSSCDVDTQKDKVILLSGEIINKADKMPSQGKFWTPMLCEEDPVLPANSVSYHHSLRLLQLSLVMGDGQTQQYCSTTSWCAQNWRSRTSAWHRVSHKCHANQFILDLTWLWAGT